MKPELARRGSRLRLAVFDVDGVLTDGRLFLLPGGEELKVFHARDGLGLKRLLQAGVEVALISGRASSVVEERARALGIAHVHQGCEDKLPVFEALLARTGIEARDAAFTGDDLPDLPVMAAAGLALTVADAHPDVRRQADFIAGLPGGRGAVREICDLLLGFREHRGS